MTAEQPNFLTDKYSNVFGFFFLVFSINDMFSHTIEVNLYIFVYIFSTRTDVLVCRCWFKIRITFY